MQSAHMLSAPTTVPARHAAFPARKPHVQVSAVRFFQLGGFVQQTRLLSELQVALETLTRHSGTALLLCPFTQQDIRLR